MITDLPPWVNFLASIVLGAFALVMFYGATWDPMPTGVALRVTVGIFSFLLAMLFFLASLYPTGKGKGGQSGS
jgi:hypothetical protein